MQNTIKTRLDVIEAYKNKAKQEEEQKIVDLKNKVRTPVNLKEALIYFDTKFGGLPVFITPAVLKVTLCLNPFKVKT